MASSGRSRSPSGTARASSLTATISCSLGSRRRDDLAQLSSGGRALASCPSAYPQTEEMSRPCPVPGAFTEGSLQSNESLKRLQLVCNLVTTPFATLATNARQWPFHRRGKACFVISFLFLEL